ncbi:IS1634 family transposase [Nostoc sp. CHAB 5784]|uniref:IS1634 family transposase n=1 Tax=Nostoc mirabile TaxID=2907820 RepID=UPI001E2EACC6|nr:IS1634 family transposase [Nostoc mirabile]MCC5669147.1 IS1634 family transposase [Nostoc mirabile CHAB5784]
MNHQKEETFIKNLDHLGIVAGIVDEIGIVEKINDLLGTDTRERVSAGEVVKTIILNGLGFVSKPLYLFSQFFEDKAIEHFLGEGIKAEDLNDDKLVRVMDKLYKYGLTKLFLIIALEVVKKYGISRKKADLKKLTQKINEEFLKIGKQIAKLAADEFEQPSLAISRIQELESKLKYHKISEVQIIERQIKDKKVLYKVTGDLRENQELISENQNSSGRFILATNILELTELSAPEILRIYKQQQSSERGFRFIKDPLFFADSLFVKNPERVETMMMLMGLCLLVYNLGQRQLRSSLKTEKATVKNQVNKLTERPTWRWIFQCFQGIHVLIMQGVKRVINLTEERCRCAVVGGGQ